MPIAAEISPRDYWIHADEEPGRGVRRLAIGRVDDALDRLERISDDPDTAVHEVRKDVKRVRSALRLGRDGIGKHAYERENALFRAAGRLLGPARDATVKIETLEAELSQLEAAIGKDAFHAWREELRRERNAQIVWLLDERAGEVANILETGRAAICDWRVHDLDWDAIQHGLRRIHRAGRKRFEAVLDAPAAETVHGWRRRAKDLRHHLEILHEVEPALAATRLKPAHRLTDLLGDHHNFAVVTKDAATRGTVLGPDRAAAVAEAHAERESALLREALELGRELYGSGKLELSRLAGN